MKFALAEEQHDPQLRALAAADPMPGWVRLLFAREPSFFQGVTPQGHTNQVVALLDGDTVAGMGCRSIRTVWIDGRPRQFGYLSGLRSKPTVRQGTLLGRGYRFLKQLHHDGRVPGYLTTIVESNRAAIEILTSRRAGLPFYLPWGRCHAYALPVRLRGSARKPQARTIRVCRGTEVDSGALFDFLAREGARRQFFPILRAADLGRPPFINLGLNDFRVALRGDRMVAAAAIWDQGAFRQIVVAGYAKVLRTVRPLLNMTCRLAGFPGLPSPNSVLPMGFLAFGCVHDNDLDAFRALLERVRADCRDAGLRFISVGLHENDPLQAVVKRIPHLRCDSRLYIVCWEDTRAVCEALRNRSVPQVELATL